MIVIYYQQLVNHLSRVNIFGNVIGIVFFFLLSVNSKSKFFVTNAV